MPTHASKLAPCALALFAGLAPLSRAEDKPPAAPAAPTAPAAGDAALTPAEIARSNELRDLAVEGRAMLESFAKAAEKPESALPQAEKERRVKTLLSRYESLLRANPDDLETLLLYGKFLRAIGERDLAFRTFLRADRISPDLPVVKHQLGAHLAENGDYASALPLLRRAAELAPKEPRYRYDFAEFLSGAGDALVSGNQLSRPERDRIMLENFAAAVRLKPAEAGYRWRFAEAFHDVERPDPAVALAAWDSIARDAKPGAETEVVGLHRARWLIDLGRADEARRLIAASRTPALDSTRRRLLDRLQAREPGLRAPFSGDKAR